jgi:ankyrin repeat protein
MSLSGSSLLAAIEQRKGRNAVEKALQDEDININACDWRGETALMHAAGEGLDDVVALLLEMSADVNKQDPSDEYTALHRAAQEGHASIVQILINGGADISIGDEDSWTALHHAANRGHLSVIRELIESGIDVNICDRFGVTPLSYALRSGKQDAAAYLRSKGGKERNRTPF